MNSVIYDLTTAPSMPNCGAPLVRKALVYAVVHHCQNLEKDTLHTSAASLMKIRNSSGPRLGPCGTPDLAIYGSEIH